MIHGLRHPAHLSDLIPALPVLIMIMIMIKIMIEFLLMRFYIYPNPILICRRCWYCSPVHEPWCLDGDLLGRWCRDGNSWGLGRDDLFLFELVPAAWRVSLCWLRWRASWQCCSFRQPHLSRWSEWLDFQEQVVAVSFWKVAGTTVSPPRCKPWLMLNKTRALPWDPVWYLLKHCCCSPPSLVSMRLSSWFRLLGIDAVWSNRLLVLYLI